MADAGETMAVRAPSRRRGAVAVVLGIVAFAILCSLGTWQVERLHWKQGLVRQIEERTNGAPRSVEAIADLQKRTNDVEYYRVAANGRFRHDAERFFLSTFGGQAGWNVHVPLDLGQNRFVFVNRGFVPYDLKDPAKRREGRTEGEATVIGLARNLATEKPSVLTPANDVARNQFFWRNLPEMVANVSLPAGATVLPFVIDAGPGRAPGGWPIGGTTVIDIPNNHLQYAFTWYGLAAVLAVMLGYQVFRAWRPVPPPRGAG